MLVPLKKPLENQNKEQLLAQVRRLTQEQQTATARFAVLQEIMERLNKGGDQAALLQIVAAYAPRLLSFDHMSVTLGAGDSGWMVQTLAGGAVDANLADGREGGLISTALAKRKPQATEHGAPGVLSPFASQMIFPLEVERDLVGTLNIAAKASAAFSAEDSLLASMLASALARALHADAYHQRTQNALAGYQRYLQELQDRNHELETFGFTIAHDLKAPLNVVYGYVKLLQTMLDENESQDVTTSLDRIERSMLNMSGMIDQLHWLAKIQDTSITATRVNVQATVEQAVWRFSDQISAHGIALEIQPDLPSALGHAAWIEEIFANLIGNAVKYLGDENAAPRIQVRGMRERPLVRYEVEDNGIGIEPEHQEAIFGMFTRLKRVQADGLGLGLALVKRIVTRLHGEVGVTSTPGVGSTFWFTLPATPKLR